MDGRGGESHENHPTSSEGLSRRRFLELVGLGTAGVALGACSSGSGHAGGGGGRTSGTAGGGGAGSTPNLPTFPLGAAEKASGVVTITMWHAMTSNNLTTLQTLARQFNASQSKIVVKLLGQASYPDTFTAYRTALGNPSTLPALVQMQSIDLADMIDSRSIISAESALRADTAFDASDIIPSASDYFTVEGVQYAMPWNCSAQVMYYNKKTFAKAGLDPSRPPATFSEYHDMSAQLKSKAGLPFGTAIKLTSSNVEDWLAKAGALLLNNSNGRHGRATAVEFGGKVGKDIMSFLAEMLSSKLAEATLETNYDNLYAIANGSVAMTIETSAALGTVLLALGGGKYHNVTLGVGPLPGLDGPGEGVPYGGAGLYIVRDRPPEEQDAAWQFIKFLLSPNAMATWSVGSGYIPITRSAIRTAAIKKAWSDAPQYRVAYEEILRTKPSPATAGAVSGALAQVETDVQNAMSSVSTGMSPTAALATAVTASNQAISSYNSSVGG
jgi:sn-glycerol 3-phosphate transport system substrate-binding protein